MINFLLRPGPLPLWGAAEEAGNLPPDPIDLPALLKNLSEGRATASALFPVARKIIWYQGYKLPAKLPVAVAVDRFAAAAQDRGRGGRRDVG